MDCFRGREMNFVSNWIVPFDGRFVVKGSGSLSKQEPETVIASAVAPVYVEGNPQCSDINASSDPTFAHINSNWGMKIGPPASGTFTFTNGADRELQGGAFASAFTS